MRRVCTMAAALVLGLITPAAAQIFDLQVTNGGNVFETSSGATLGLIAPAVGSDAVIGISAVYLGSQTVAILNTSLQGPSDFTLQGAGSPTLKPGDRYPFTVHYHATSSSLEQAILTVMYQEATATPVTANFRLSFTGSAPQVVVSYALASDHNARPIANNGQIVLPVTAPGATAQATVTLTNTGSGPAAISSVAISGAPFALLNLPLLPANLAASQSLTFTVAASPAAAGSYSSNLQIASPSGAFACTVAVTSGTTDATFVLGSGNTSSTVAPGATIPFPDTLVGGKSSLSLQLVNQTASSISIAAITLTGSSDFQLSSALQLPVTLAPGDSGSLSLVFTPSQAQAITTTLKIGSDTFLLSGNGLAAALGFRYTAADGVDAVSPNGTLIFPATAIGASQSVNLIVRNQTAQNVTVNQAGIAAATSPFHLASPSPFPLSLAPQQEIQFQLSFTPQAVGVLTTTLAVDSYSFTLRGVGLPPTTLPNVSLTGPQGSIGPLQQASVTVSLQSAYAVDLTGTLSMSFDSQALAADPSLQFSAGGKTVNFKIPAGALVATFPNGLSRIGLQSGSVAGNIQLSTTVQTSANFDVTSPTPPALTFHVDAAVPSILGVSVTGGSGAYQIQIVGMTTDRNLKQFDFQFFSSGILPLSASTLTLDIAATAHSWFQDSASMQFGGLFSLSVPLQISLPSNTSTFTLANIIRSISVRAVNDLGSSAPFLASVQ